MEVYDLRRRLGVLAILYGCPHHQTKRVVDRALRRKNLNLANAGDYIAQAMSELSIRDVHLAKRPRRRRPAPLLPDEKEPLPYE